MAPSMLGVYLMELDEFSVVVVGALGSVQCCKLVVCSMRWKICVKHALNVSQFMQEVQFYEHITQQEMPSAGGELN